MKFELLKIHCRSCLASRPQFWNRFIFLNAMKGIAHLTWLVHLLWSSWMDMVRIQRESFHKRCLSHPILLVHMLLSQQSDGVLPSKPGSISGFFRKMPRLACMCWFLQKLFISQCFLVTQKPNKAAFLTPMIRSDIWVLGGKTVFGCQSQLNDIEWCLMGWRGQLDTCDWLCASFLLRDFNSTSFQSEATSCRFFPQCLCRS